MLAIFLSVTSSKLVRFENIWQSQKSTAVERIFRKAFIWGDGGSTSQRAFALIRRAESPLILRYRDAAERREKGRLCLSRAKVYLLFRTIEIYNKKKLIYRETTLRLQKTSGLSCENALVLHSSSHLFRESRHSN